MDHVSDGRIVHTHSRLYRRQGQDDETTSSTPRPTARPTPTASARPTDFTTSANLGFQHLNTNFTYGIWNRSLPFDLGCRNCTGTGDVKVSASHIRIDWSDKDKTSAFETGHLEVNLTGFSLAIGLRATPINNKKSITIFETVLTGVKVPGLVKIGLVFALDLRFEAKVKQSAAIGFGFDVTVSSLVFCSL